jgi:hypothetical protein
MDERRDPPADVGRDVRRVPAGEAEVREHRVRRGGDIGGGVEERAVQVEEDGADRRRAHPADASAARIAAIVAL